MEVLTPRQAIRAKCLDCTCQQPKEVRHCRVMTCSLWPHRMGRRPPRELDSHTSEVEILMLQDELEEDHDPIATGALDGQTAELCGATV